MFRLATLGAVSLTTSDGQPVRALLSQPKRLALLVYLAAHAGRGAPSRDRLVALFWRDADDEHARAALSRSLHVLRRALDERAIVTQGNEVATDPTVLSCDLTAFDRALSNGADGEALELYRGDFLVGFFVSGAGGFDEWVDRERDRLRAGAREAARRLADREERQGHVGLAAHWARVACAHAPYDEPLARRLMELLVRVGDRAGALAYYEEFGRRLAKDLDVEPSPDTRELERAIRAEEATYVDPPAAIAASPRTGAASGQETAARRTRVRLLRPAVPLILALLAVGWWIAMRSPATADPRERKAIAVLPFDNLSPDSATALFAAGVIEDLSLQLSRIGDLRLMSRNAVTALQEAGASLGELADSLGLLAVLSGSIRREGDSLRLVTRLEDPHTGTLLWAERYDRAVGEVFAVQGDLALHIANALEVRLSPVERQELSQAPTRSVEAYAYVIRAERLINPEPKTPADAQTAEEFLHRALALDSGFARAYNALAAVHFWRAMISADLREADSVVAYAESAIARRPDRKERQVSYRLIALSFAAKDWNRQALDANLRAVELDTTFYWGSVGVAAHAMWLGQYDQAVRWFHRAMSLRPGDETAYGGLGDVWIQLDSLPEAERWKARVRELFPGEPSAYEGLAWIQLLRGDTTGARERLDSATALAGELWDYDHIALLLEVELAGRNYAGAEAHYRQLQDAGVGPLGPEVLLRRDNCKSARLSMGFVDAMTGRHSRAEAAFEEIRRRGDDALSRGQDHVCIRYERALVEAAAGDRSLALNWLRQAIDHGWVGHRYARFEPLLAGLHGEAEFEEILGLAGARADSLRSRIRRQSTDG